MLQLIGILLEGKGDYCLDTYAMVKVLQKLLEDSRG